MRHGDFDYALEEEDSLDESGGLPFHVSRKSSVSRPRTAEDILAENRRDSKRGLVADNIKSPLQSSHFAQGARDLLIDDSLTSIENLLADSQENELVATKETSEKSDDDISEIDPEKDFQVNLPKARPSSFFEKNQDTKDFFNREEAEDSQSKHSDAIQSKDSDQEAYSTDIDDQDVDDEEAYSEDFDDDDNDDDDHLAGHNQIKAGGDTVFSLETHTPTEKKRPTPPALSDSPKLQQVYPRQQQFASIGNELREAKSQIIAYAEDIASSCPASSAEDSIQIDLTALTNSVLKQYPHAIAVSNEFCQKSGQKLFDMKWLKSQFVSSLDRDAAANDWYDARQTVSSYDLSSAFRDSQPGLLQPDVDRLVRQAVFSSSLSPSDSTDKQKDIILSRDAVVTAFRSSHELQSISAELSEPDPQQWTISSLPRKDTFSASAPVALEQIAGHTTPSPSTHQHQPPSSAKDAQHFHTIHPRSRHQALKSAPAERGQTPIKTDFEQAEKESYYSLDDHLSTSHAADTSQAQADHSLDSEDDAILEKEQLYAFENQEDIARNDTVHKEEQQYAFENQEDVTGNDTVHKEEQQYAFEHQEDVTRNDTVHKEEQQYAFENQEDVTRNDTVHKEEQQYAFENQEDVTRNDTVHKTEHPQRSTKNDTEEVARNDTILKKEQDKSFSKDDKEESSEVRITNSVNDLPRPPKSKEMSSRSMSGDQNTPSASADQSPQPPPIVDRVLPGETRDVVEVAALALARAAELLKDGTSARAQAVIKENGPREEDLLAALAREMVVKTVSRPRAIPIRVHKKVVTPPPAHDHKIKRQPSSFIETKQKSRLRSERMAWWEAAAFEAAGILDTKPPIQHKIQKKSDYVTEQDVRAVASDFQFQSQYLDITSHFASSQSAIDNDHLDTSDLIMRNAITESLRELLTDKDTVAYIRRDALAKIQASSSSSPAPRSGIQKLYTASNRHKGRRISKLH